MLLKLYLFITGITGKFEIDSNMSKLTIKAIRYGLAYVQIDERNGRKKKY